MAGVSDSRHPDDLRIHLDQILSADALLAQPAGGETEAEARTRLSAQLPSRLKARVSEALAALSEAAPGISAAEADKLLTTRAARDALREGREALARVDAHLASVTSERDPHIGRKYGVYGKNPETFGGVLRALTQADDENTRISALPEANPERALAFTPVIASAVSEARAHLSAQLGERFATRAEFSRKVVVKDSTLSEARASIAAVRNHLYANLPSRKRDPDLRNYGFRPLPTRTSGSPDDGGDIAEEPEVALEERAVKAADETQAA